ncbi:hypothetical protein AB0B66_34090 [Catellatospora sp. NPDC049111]|uniref:hypothetical protein n=1 Tax=Catellatospora sp. NPDC049111 TaxID=3155271 RepID=UPI0033C5AC40
MQHAEHPGGTAMSRLASGAGRPLATGRRLGAGGQAEVLEIRGSHTEVVKRYFPASLNRDPRLPRRLAAMVAHPPRWRDANGHPVLAWPTDLALERGHVVGFVMPRIDTARTVELHAVTNMSTRQEPSMPAWLADFGWRYHVQAALNLAHAVDAVHSLGTVVGDFNERNVRVSQTALVTLLDCDSMQVTDPSTGDVFLCGVGRPEWNPPELAGADWSTTVRAPSSDLFALAIHIYQLLLRGEHPFRGVWTAAGDKPSVPALAARGIWVGAGGQLTARPGRVGLSVLPDHIDALLRQTFGNGATDPARRATARDWITALRRLAGELADCPVDPAHQYPAGLSACPWCASAGTTAVAPPVTVPLPPATAPVTVPTPPAAVTPPTGYPVYTPPPPPAVWPMVIGYQAPRPARTGRIVAWIAAACALLLVTLCLCQPFRLLQSPGDGAKANATTQLGAMRDILRQSSAHRARVIAAVDDVKACRAVGQAAQAFTAAAVARLDFHRRVLQLPLHAVGDGERLRTLLASALQASADADRAFAAWARARISRCTTGSYRTGDFEAAERHSATASAHKASFAQLWNSITPTSWHTTAQTI